MRRNNINIGINTSTKKKNTKAAGAHDRTAGRTALTQHRFTHMRKKGERQETVMPDRKFAVEEGGLSNRWRD